ncbi:MAG TPA: hypothetical protein VK611_04470 [Acidimicrobiales bacterium]|nr:hypothetical protein [Acidimicrobiales bacterium]
MPVGDAPDAPDGRGEPQADRETRAPAGGARFFRRYGRVLVAVVAFALIALAALRGSGDHDTGTADEGPPTGRPAGDDVSSAPDSAAEAVDESSTTLTTLTPPDVAHERPAVALDVVPGTGDPVEVARWWAATYAVYGGAEPPSALADRVAPLTAPAFLQSLRDVLPAASYDAPLELEGVTGNEVAAGAGSKVVRVSVETTVALVIYDVTLTEAPPGSWLVSQASRV